MKKIVFLDIDGTLVDFNSRMPESAEKALQLAKASGCLIALCTGRTYTNIYPWLMKFPFDGIVASAGAYINCGEENIFHNTLDNDKLSVLARQLMAHDASYMFQGLKGRYTDAANLKKMTDYLLSLGFENTEEMDSMTVCEHPYRMQMIESGMYFGADIDTYFKITGSSFGHDRIFSGEITCRGIDKATGMQKLMDHLEVDRKDSIAFGDGPNDFEMLEYAGVGVAMGNAVETLKNLADMVTDDILEDGIYTGFKKLGLI